MPVNGRSWGFDVSEGRHNPLPHIALSTTAPKSVYGETPPLATHLAAELRELQAPGRPEWTCPVLPDSLSGAAGLREMCYCAKGSCRPRRGDRRITCGAASMTRYKRVISRRASGSCSGDGSSLPGRRGGRAEPVPSPGHHRPLRNRRLPGARKPGHREGRRRESRHRRAVPAEVSVAGTRPGPPAALAVKQSRQPRVRTRPCRVLTNRDGREEQIDGRGRLRLWRWS